jgi:hypothetical protein
MPETAKIRPSKFTSTATGTKGGDMKKILLVLMVAAFVPALGLAEWLPPLTVPSGDTVDSTKVKTGSIAGSDIVNPLRIPTYDLYVKNVVIGDSLKGKSLALTSYLIANGATILRGGATVTGTVAATVIQGDTIKANYPVLWGPNIGDFTVVNTDSVASAGAANDTTGTRVYWRRYFSWDSVESPSMKTGIYSTVFVPGGALNPDSLVVNLWFDGTHANADSGAAMIVIKGQSGNIVSTGWVTVAAASTWEHKGYVIPTPFTRNEEYEMLVYTKSVSGGRWCWSVPRFK